MPSTAGRDESNSMNANNTKDYNSNSENIRNESKGTPAITGMPSTPGMQATVVKPGMQATARTIETS
jgi:hypothetical protein